MTPLSSQDRPDPRSVFQGMALLACGRAEGLEKFKGTVNGFLAALAPGIAYNIVFMLLALMQKDAVVGVIRVELSLCSFLALPVISNWFAVRWGKEDRWLRYATAAAWSQWTSVFVLALVMAIAAFLMPRVAEMPGFGNAAIAATQLYDLWLGIFIARCGLGITRWRAVLVAVAVLLFVLACYGLASVLPPHHGFLAEVLSVDVRAHQAGSGA